MSRPKLFFLLAAVVVMCGAMAMVVPGVSPYARYPFHVVRCGGQPILAWAFAGDYFYRTPGSEGYGVDPFVTRYFCTEEEARDAGYDPAPP
jgi:hypothetical protein